MIAGQSIGPRRLLHGAALCLALLPLACAPVDQGVRKAAPDVTPVARASAASDAVRAHYAAAQARLLAKGMLRSDGGGQDTRLTDTMLAENFIRIALYDEYARSGGGIVARENASHLRRWVEPVRVGLRFGATVPETLRATDTARIASYLARLSRVTGHPISLADADANFIIHIVGEDDRRALGPQLRADMPGIGGADLAAITDMPLSTYCLVVAMSQGKSGVYRRATAVIRAEHPDLLRLSCMHEEIAQGLGLANDSPRARPSIFNDDEEFALRTAHDELLLRILYDPALRPGMTEAEARPIIQSLARKLLGAGS